MVREQIYTEVAFGVQTVALKNYCLSIHQDTWILFSTFHAVMTYGDDGTLMQYALSLYALDGSTV